MPHTLLLADDSVTIQRVIELTFADEDIQVIAVSDGDQAIARIEAAPPDIILADVGMPGKNGYEVAQYVKQSPRLAHIPVVLLTGAFEPVDQARATAAGCEGVLAKPFEPQLVIGRVKELLGKSRPGPSPSGAPAAAPPAPAANSWAPKLADQIFSTPEAAPPSGGTELNTYFDRLDQAFANLSAPAPPAVPARAGPAAAPEDVDWFGTVKSAESGPAPDHWDIAAPPLAPPDLPMSYEAALPDFNQRPQGPMAPVSERPAAAPAPIEPPPPPAPVVRAAAPAALPAIADAFAALLAAEQSAAQPSPTPVWPTSAPTAAAITDDVVEEVVRRVLDRLSDGVVRETVSEIVSVAAERLVREEIERIKASIK